MAHSKRNKPIPLAVASDDEDDDDASSSEEEEDTDSDESAGSGASSGSDSDDEDDIAAQIGGPLAGLGGRQLNTSFLRPLGQPAQPVVPSNPAPPRLNMVAPTPGAGLVRPLAPQAAPMPAPFRGVAPTLTPIKPIIPITAVAPRLNLTKTATPAAPAVAPTLLRPPTLTKPAPTLPLQLVTPQVEEVVAQLRGMELSQGAPPQTGQLDDYLAREADETPAAFAARSEIARRLSALNLTHVQAVTLSQLYMKKGIYGAAYPPQIEDILARYQGALASTVAS